MVSTSFIGFLLAALQFSSVDLTMVTVPANRRVDIPLLPVGEVEVRREETISRLKVKVERVDALLASDPIMRAYVAWAVSPEGEFENLGELEVNGRRAEVETATSLRQEYRSSSESELILFQLHWQVWIFPSLANL